MRSALFVSLAFVLAASAAAAPDQRLTPVADSGSPPPPKPSNWAKKRDQVPVVPAKPIDISQQLCPRPMAVCPISAYVPNTLSDWIEQGFECVELKEDLNNCGGCGSVDAHYDCTAVPGALGVSCDIGTCRVQSCLSNYSLAPDGKSCVPMQ